MKYQKKQKTKKKPKKPKKPKKNQKNQIKKPKKLQLPFKLASLSFSSLPHVFAVESFQHLFVCFVWQFGSLFGSLAVCLAVSTSQSANIINVMLFQRASEHQLQHCSLFLPLSLLFSSLFSTPFEAFTTSEVLLSQPPYRHPEQAENGFCCVWGYVE